MLFTSLFFSVALAAEHLAVLCHGAATVTPRGDVAALHDERIRLPCANLYVSFCCFYQLFLEVVNVIYLVDAFHYLISVFIDKSNTLVVRVVEMQPADRPAVIVIGKDGKIGL